MKTYTIRPPIGLITFCSQEQEKAVAGFIRNHKVEPNILYIHKKLYYAAYLPEEANHGDQKGQINQT